ncbi:MAG TPA: DnaJ domain-containing protein [Longimicrobium sp.]|nr:DnaJ domain-containing protein [Longimicrobium sp.]
MSPTTIHADDLYERLGIERDASRDQVRAAYRALLRVYPPERAPEEFKRIREAYETLNDPASRAEYDRAPSAAVQRLLRMASAAMDAQGYPEAEQHLRQVLAEDSTLDYARNWLGLCLLYQQKPEQALPLFEQLLQRDEPAPAWFANAGHACARLRRFADAESMFRRAIVAADAGGEDVTGYYVALADLYVEHKNFDAAEQVLEKAIRHDGQVDFEDLQYFTKLLEVQLLRNDAARVNAVLYRIKVVARDEQQRDYTSWKLASLAAELVAAGAFTLAAAVGRAGSELKPTDSDFRSLVQVASLLSQKQHEEAQQMLRTHPCFWGEGRLAGLNQAIRKHCSDLRVFGGMKPLGGVPPLFTLNGFGTMLYGERDPDGETRSHVATLYFVGLFIPLIPLACYRVIHDGGRSWRFLGKVPFSRGNKIHLACSLSVLFIFCLTVALTPATDGSSYGSGTGTYAGSDYGATPTDTGFANTFVAPTPSAAPVGGDGQRVSIEGERLRVKGMEWQIQRLESRQDSLVRAIDELAGQISTMESGASGSTIPQGEYTRYRRLVDHHNGLVDDYNDNRAELQRRTTEYSGALAALNARIDRYNATH